MLAVLPAIASTETVRITKAIEDRAIITRRNGDFYLIEKGVGCLSLWRYEGKTVLIVSPGLFLGVGSKLLIPELDQECRIWKAELLSSPVAPRPSVQPPMPAPAAGTSLKSATSDSAAIVAIQKGLRLVGYDTGPADGAIGARTASALAKYRTSKGHPSTEDGLRRTLMALALDVFTRNPNSQDALQISLELITVLSTPSAGRRLSRVETSEPRRSGCEDGHWIASVSDGGEIVKLGDGSIWAIDSIDRINTTLWLSTEEIIICGDRLINTDTGDAVDATRIK